MSVSVTPRKRYKDLAMDMPRWQCRARALVLLVLLSFAGCAVQRPPVYIRDNIRYCVSASPIWRDTWWQHYERGVSCAAGEFWDDALSSFQTALATPLSRHDQRRITTYGLHVLDDYFPHRELGIVYYRLGRHREAQRELETSLSTAASAKAKFYLNKVRESLLRQSGRDTTPPRIRLDTPADGLLTNRLSVMVTGQAEDDTYVAAVSINGHELFIEVAEPRQSFAEEVVLRDGPNIIEIVARDLLGQQTRHRLAVSLDRYGPQVSIYRAALHGTPLQPQARVQGFLSDRSPLTRFVLAGSPVPLPGGTAREFQHDIPVPPGTTTLAFEAEDVAGNLTRGHIALATPTPASPGYRTGYRVPFALPPWTAWPAVPRRAAWPALVRWAALHPDAVLADGAVSPGTALRMAQNPGAPPIIKLKALPDQKVVYTDAMYLEGEVIGVNPLARFVIAGEPLLHLQCQRHSCYQFFFGYIASLTEGKNTFRLEVEDTQGSRREDDLVIVRAVLSSRQLGSRLQVTLMPFALHGTPTQELAGAVYEGLIETLVRRRRFRFVERSQLQTILQELKLSQTDLVDPAHAVKVGKLVNAEGIVLGAVKETVMPPSLDVYARFVDVETSEILAAEDVYGEYVTPSAFKKLMEGLALKLQGHFPLLEGPVIVNEGKNLLVALTRQQGMKPHMKILVFRPGGELKHGDRVLKRPDKILGEARITAVSDDLSEARLLQPDADIREHDLVIVK